MKIQNKDNLRIWDSSNIAESFPGIVMPLTFSIARRGYELVYKSQGYESGLSWYELEANHRTFNSMIGIFAGRMYYNLVNWYKFIGLFPNNRQNQKYLDEQLQTIGDAVYLPPQNYSFNYRVRFWKKLVRRALFFERERKNYWRYLDDTFHKYNNLSQEKDLFKLLERYAFLEQNAVPHMGRAADNDFFVMTYNGAVKKRLRRWLGQAAEAHNDFLGALHDVISARQAILLIQIADNVKNDPRALGLIRSSDYPALDKHLAKTATHRLLTEYRTKFLHRFAEDQKIEAINPLLELGGFYSLIKTYLQLDINETTKRQNDAIDNELKRGREITKQLNIIQKIIYALLLRRLKHHLRIREHNRLLRGKVYALLRDLFVEFGETLAEQKLIEDPRDIYYLDIEELFQFADGLDYIGDFCDRVKDRKAKYISYKQIKAPTRFVTKGAITALPTDFAVDSGAKSVITDTILMGTIASPGVVEGKVIVLHEPTMPNEPFDILVVSHTDPGWTPLIALAKGLIVEHGGILSHAAIVTRELGIPSIIGIEGVTTKLQAGQRVRLDATKGTVEQL